MRQNEEHRQATLAANRRIGALEAELEDAKGKAQMQSKGAEQLSRALDDVKANLQDMSRQRDAKVCELGEEHRRCAALQEQLNQAVEQHQLDMKQSQVAEDRLTAEVSVQ